MIAEECVKKMKSTKVFLLAVFVLILLCINPSTAAVPVAQFNGTPTIGSAPLTVNFKDISTGVPSGWAWYFGDETYTAPWTLMTANAEWSARFGHKSVAMPDGSIVLMGGWDDSGFKDDVWRSTNNGATWMRMNLSSGWGGRWGFSSAVMPDGSIVLMGGSTNYQKNDVWKSTDNGKTWSQLTANAEWSIRSGQSTVVMPDGSIVLMGGMAGGDNFKMTYGGQQITAQHGLW